MKYITKRILISAGALFILLPMTAVCYLLFLYPGDISARQTENRFIFGATYMTMNNPYYPILDSYLRREIESNNDILLTRDAAMDQNRQNEEIRELIQAGARVIFLAPVDWDSAQEGLKIAVNIILLEHITACSGAERIQGFFRYYYRTQAICNPCFRRV